MRDEFATEEFLLDDPEEETETGVPGADEESADDTEESDDDEVSGLQEEEE